MSRPNENEDLVADFINDNRQREATGYLAAFVWIGSGLAFYLFTDGVSFFSWSALLFFTLGTFFVALPLGVGAYYLQRLWAKFLPNSVAGLLMIPVAGAFVFRVARSVFEALT